MTTGELRILAYQAEKELRWADAAGLYFDALAAYPKKHPQDALANLDKETLTRRAEACASTARYELLHPAMPPFDSWQQERNRELSDRDEHEESYVGDRGY